MSNGRRFSWLGVVVGITIATPVIVVLLTAIYLLSDYYGFSILSLDDFDDRIKYFLSATAQVLGALFALVFSITLIAVQFVTKYTHRTMRVVFTKSINWYMLLFASSVVFPLAWLLINPSWGWAIISLIWGGIIILSLVPFFLYLRERINIETVIEYLKRKAMKEVCVEPDFSREINEPAEKDITAIDNIAMGAFGDHNYEVFRRAEMALASFAWEHEAKCVKLEENSSQKNLHSFVFRVLRDTCIETIDNPRAPIITLRHIGKETAKAMWKKLYKTCEETHKLIDEIQKQSNSYKRRTVSIACAEASHFITISLSPYTTDSDLASVGKVYYSIFSLELELYRRHRDNLWFDDIWDEIDHTVELMKFYLRRQDLTEGNFLKTSLDHFFGYINKFIDEDYSIGGRVFEGVAHKITLFVLSEAPNIRFASQFAENLNKAGQRCIDYRPDNGMWGLIGKGLIKESQPLFILSGKNS